MDYKRDAMRPHMEQQKVIISRPERFCGVHKREVKMDTKRNNNDVTRLCWSNGSEVVNRFVHLDLQKPLEIP